MTSLEGGGARLTMSQQALEGIDELRTFLFKNVYETHQVHTDFIKAMKVLRELFAYFMSHDDYWKPVIDYPEGTPRERMVIDCVAGMTDRYALDLYSNIFLPKPWRVL